VFFFVLSDVKIDRQKLSQRERNKTTQLIFVRSSQGMKFFRDAIKLHSLLLTHCLYNNISAENCSLITF
jgi:hypothetical protein